MPTVPIVPQSIATAPFAVTETKSVEAMLLAAYAEWDGSGASGAFLPCLELYSDAGIRLGRYFPSTPVAAGDSAVVSYVPLGAPPAVASSAVGQVVRWDAVLHGTGSDPTGYVTTDAGWYTVIGNLFIGWLDLYFSAPVPGAGSGIYELAVPAGLGNFDGTNPSPLGNGRYSHAGGKSYVATLTPLFTSYSRWLIEYYDPVAVADVLVTATPPWGGYVHFDSIYTGFVVARL